MTAIAGLAPSQVPNRYTVVRDLTKRSGMATVVLAYDQQAGRPVVLKIMRERDYMQLEWCERFRREAYWLMELDPKLVVRGCGYTEEPSLPCIVMEYLEGSDLSVLRREAGSLTVTLACELVVKAAHCLSGVHAAELLHRDIKSANIMAGADGQVRLIDFGLAYYLGEAEPPLSPQTIWQPRFNIRLTAVDAFVGTVAYTAFEQHCGVWGLDHRADQYSLGVVLYELLTGQLPFAGDSVVAIMINQEDRAMTALHTARPDAPRALSQVVDRMLAFEPDDRFDSVAAAATAIEQAAR